jgi:hypothetical protein
MAGNTKSLEKIPSPLIRFARSQTARRIFTRSSVAVPDRGNAMGALIRIPNAQSNVPARLSAGQPSHLGERNSSRREQIARQLAKWEAPTLPDHVLDALATIFLMQPGHELTPFFVWLDHRLRR